MYRIAKNVSWIREGGNQADGGGLWIDLAVHKNHSALMRVFRTVGEFQLQFHLLGTAWRASRWQERTNGVRLGLMRSIVLSRRKTDFM